MTAYQNFLDFFSMRNKERLDGLSESYFIAMTEEERLMAFSFLLERVEAGGTEESVNGLFRADPVRAIDPVKRLLLAGVLNPEAQIAAAWNVLRAGNDDSVIPVFFRFMSSPDRRLRAKSAYYVPADISNEEIKKCLQAMIITETEQLARINAVDKFLESYGVTRDSVGETEYKEIYRGLHGDDVKKKAEIFRRLDIMYRKRNP